MTRLRGWRALRTIRDLALSRALVVVAVWLVGSSAALACSSFSAAPEPGAGGDEASTDGASPGDADPVDASTPDARADTAPPSTATCDAGSARACTDRYLFLTKATLRTDFASVPAGVSKLQPADAFCAAQANLDTHADLHNREWRAWMCTTTENAVTRVIGTMDARYINRDGNVLFTDRMALAGANPQRAIDTRPIEVWTGCGPTGLHETFPTCDDWSTTGAKGQAGRALATNRDWSSYAELPCTTTLPVYCVEYVP
ncbi:MAG: Myxococcus cysteine-rich repeat-containing protein [Labilithrix sp.]|nr:Myxococcus cysteine-rich repeat-containing protein [Labilithrix sp.]